MSKYEEATATLEYVRSCLTGAHEDLTKLTHHIGALFDHLDSIMSALVQSKQTEGGTA